MHVRARPRPADGRARRARADRVAAAGPAGGQPARRRRPPARRRLRRRGLRRPHRRPDRRLAAAARADGCAGAGSTRSSPTASSSKAPGTRDGCARTPRCGCPARASPATSTWRAPRSTSPTGDALDGTGITVGGSLLAGRHATGPAFTASGRVRLAGARIGGDLVFSGAEIVSTTIPDPGEDAPEGSRAPVLPAGIVDPAACLVGRPPARRRQPGARRRPAHHRHRPAAQRRDRRLPAAVGRAAHRGQRARDRAAGRRHGDRRRHRGPRHRPRTDLLRGPAAARRRDRAGNGEPVGGAPDRAGRLRAARRPAARRRRALPAPGPVRGHAADAERGRRRDAGLHRRHADPAAAASRRHARGPRSTCAPPRSARTSCASRGSPRQAACGCAWPTCASPSSSSTPRSARRAAPATRSTSTA